MNDIYKKFKIKKVEILKFCISHNIPTIKRPMANLSARVTVSELLANLRIEYDIIFESGDICSISGNNIDKLLGCLKNVIDPNLSEIKEVVASLLGHIESILPNQHQIKELTNEFERAIDLCDEFLRISV